MKEVIDPSQHRGTEDRGSGLNVVYWSYLGLPQSEEMEVYVFLFRDSKMLSGTYFYWKNPGLNLYLLYLFFFTIFPEQLRLFLLTNCCGLFCLSLVSLCIVLGV